MSAAPVLARPGEMPVGAGGRVVPFDYSFEYELKGEPEKTHSKTVRVSIEGPFTAVAIGYGIVPKSMPQRFGPGKVADYETPSINGGKVVLPINVSQVPMGAIVKSFERALSSAPRFAKGGGLADLLRNGFRMRRDLADLVANTGGNATVALSTLEELFEIVQVPPDQVPFLYALRDEGSGREFQSQPILSIAGLGISNGDRPFRQFARPIVFEPQTAIRLDVTEKSDFIGGLHFSLQGFKVLGTPGTPTGFRRR